MKKLIIALFFIPNVVMSMGQDPYDSDQECCLRHKDKQLNKAVKERNLERVLTILNTEPIWLPKIIKEALIINKDKTDDKIKALLVLRLPKDEQESFKKS